MQAHQSGGGVGDRISQRQEMPADQASSPLLGRKFTHGALTAGSVAVVAHRFADLGQPIGGGALPRLQLLIDIAAFGGLGI